MKKQVPLIIGMVVGMIALTELYLEWWVVDVIHGELLTFAQILLAAAYVLGGINLIQVNWPKIRRREADWGYKVVLMGSAALMLLVGVPWHGCSDAPGRLTVMASPEAGDRAMISVRTTRPEAQIKIDNEVRNEVREDPGGGESGPLVVPVEPGKHTVVVSMELYGYGEYRQEVELAPGQAVLIETNLPMLWGKDGRAYKWMYNYIFDPCNSTMFALLAFFIASAAFRAFRARNVEAALLLGSAILIMLGRAPIGSAISDFLPAFSDWLVDVGNNSGRRAIMMGAALGAIATGLRVILGLERSHLGSD